MSSIKKYSPPSAGTWRTEMAKIADVFRLWDVEVWGAMPNVPETLANRNYPLRTECAVTVTFVKDGKTVTLAMDEYAYPPLNLKVLALCIDDMRMIERRGVSNTMQSAYLQLAAPPAGQTPWEILGVAPNATRDEVEAIYRVKAKAAHPDQGGSDEAMAILNAARTAALKAATQ